MLLGNGKVWTWMGGYDINIRLVTVSENEEKIEIKITNPYEGTQTIYLPSKDLTFVVLEKLVRKAKNRFKKDKQKHYIL